MTQLITDAASFRDQALEGFVASHRRLVRAVDGGVVRSTALAPDQVALVVGGGSGQYPAFAGLVGTGLASGAVCGSSATRRASLSTSGNQWPWACCSARPSSSASTARPPSAD